MDVNFLSPNSMLIQGATMSDFESMIDRLLDNILEFIPQQEETPKSRLNKRKEAAAELRVSLVTLDAWTKAGIINACRVGGRVYYTDKDIADALKRASK